MNIVYFETVLKLFCTTLYKKFYLKNFQNVNVYLKITIFKLLFFECPLTDFDQIKSGMSFSQALINVKNILNFLSTGS